MRSAGLEPAGVDVIPIESANDLGIANARPKVLLLDDTMELQIILEL
jgi:hypothetical protein